MAFYSLLSNATTVSNGTAINPQNVGKREFCAVQVKITGTATVVVEGRTSPNMGYEILQTFTASGCDTVMLMPDMRASVSAISSGAVYAELVE